MANEAYIALLSMPLAEARWPDCSITFTVGEYQLCGLERGDAAGRVVIDLAAEPDRRVALHQVV